MTVQNASITDNALQDYLDTTDVPSGAEYECYTPENARSKAEGYIKDSLWAFTLKAINDAGLLKIELSDKALECLQKCQVELCEDANDLILALVTDIDELIEWAINVDGLGHFLNTYDDQLIEHEYLGNEYVIIRVN
jgi:hypothetical protein